MRKGYAMRVNNVSNQPSFGMAWKLDQKCLVGADRSELKKISQFLAKNYSELDEKTQGVHSVICAGVDNGKIETLSVRVAPEIHGFKSLMATIFKIYKDDVEFNKTKKIPEYFALKLPFDKIISGDFDFMAEVQRTALAATRRFDTKKNIAAELRNSITSSK